MRVAAPDGDEHIRGQPGSPCLTPRLTPPLLLKHDQALDDLPHEDLRRRLRRSGAACLSHANTQPRPCTSRHQAPTFFMVTSVGGGSRIV